ncbi:phosphoribosylanthranilate isomerase, partial [Leuconostoc lactis]
TVNNLQTAINQVQPEWVDVSSGTEVDGLKDLTLMSELVTIAHQN